MLETLGSTFNSCVNTVFSTSDHRAKCVVALLLFWIGYIRLQTKRSDKSGKVYHWKDLLKVWNITSEEYWKTVDALIIGEPFKLIEISKEEKDEHGDSIKIKDKAVKNKPKGVIGLIDAYFLIQIKNILEHISNIDKLWGKTATFINNGTVINLDISNTTP